MQPPSHRPATICHRGAGESHVKWNMPARTSAPSTASPMTSAAIGNDEAEDAVGCDTGERFAGRLVDGEGEQPEEQRGPAGQQRAEPPLRREARAQRVDEDRAEPRTACAPREQ